MQQEKPEDYVIATGEQHSVREFMEAVFNEMGVAIEWHSSADEVGIAPSSRQPF